MTTFHSSSEKAIKAIILLQSHIRGLLTRSQLSNNPFYIGTFLPYIDPDLPYTFASNSLITEDEIKYLLRTFQPLNDNVPVICLKTIEYSNGCQYYGEWNQVNNQKHGRGILKWPDCPTYYGQFRMDKANGKGRLVFRQGEEYEGDWCDNRANGLGLYKNKDVKYEGKWKDDRQDGIGTETWTDGTCYTGEFKNGQKTGTGKFRYVDGSTYSGTFLNNKLHGKGLYIWADKREYKGEWKYNKIEGEGVFKWPDGRKYIGHYKNDKKDGYGIFEWPDGKKYKGYWKNGKQQGDGEFYNPKDRTWQKGRWKNGKQESFTNMSTSNSNSKENSQQFINIIKA